VTDPLRESGLINKTKHTDAAFTCLGGGAYHGDMSLSLPFSKHLPL
jgi:hypothetical protein